MGFHYGGVYFGERLNLLVVEKVSSVVQLDGLSLTLLSGVEPAGYA
jgi:hypothetical protein